MALRLRIPGREWHLGVLAVAAGALVLFGAAGCVSEAAPGGHAGETTSGAASSGAMTPTPAKILVAHRGASAYAPEHTRPAYELAIEMGADFIEPDLQLTADSVLIALHDETLDRTTNAREVFPDRYREEEVRGETVRRWYAVDFTLDEIRTLDAGSWFDAPFAGERVPTFEEVIEIASGRAGIFPETKAPDAYAEQGFHMEELVVETLRRHGLDTPGADPATPVFLQSFSEASLRVLRHELGSELPSTFLLSRDEAAVRWLTPEGLARVADFATGIGPDKALLIDVPSATADAHAAGLTVIPYTFRGDRPGDFGTVKFDSVAEEMSHFLYVIGVDGLFTNNPDEFERR